MRKLTEDDLLVIVKSIIDVTWNKYSHPEWVLGGPSQNLRSMVLDKISSDGRLTVYERYYDSPSIVFGDGFDSDVVLGKGDFPLPYEFGDQFEFDAASDQFFEKVQSIIDIYRM